MRIHILCSTKYIYNIVDKLINLYNTNDGNWFVRLNIDKI